MSRRLGDISLTSDYNLRRQPGSSERTWARHVGTSTLGTEGRNRNVGCEDCGRNWY
jgi:hypothetical protein